MKRIAAAAVLTAMAFATAPATAVPIQGGCVAVTIGATSASCAYQATGPASFVAASVSGFQIRVTRPDGTTRVFIGQAFGGCGAHVPGPQYGTIISEAGDTVTLSVSAACYRAGVIPSTPVNNPGPDPLVDDPAIGNPLPAVINVPPQATPVGANTQAGLLVATEGI